MCERLTERVGDGIRYDNGEYTVTCYPKNDNLRPVDKLAAKLCEFEEKIENGTLIELPCKVGEKIYFVTYDYDVNHHIRYYISEGEIQSFAVYNDGVWAYSRHSDGLTFWHKTDSFGINVFFSREDAEKSIAERTGV